jgi:hypothetical protein
MEWTEGGRKDREVGAMEHEVNDSLEYHEEQVHLMHVSFV